MELRTQLRRLGAGLAPATGSDAPGALSNEALLEVLSNRRRRYALHHLKRTGETVSVGDLARIVAGWENDKPPEAVSGAERKRVYTALHQQHLPKMDELGLVEFDRSRGEVTVAPAVRDRRIYADVAAASAVPWAAAYLAVGGVGSVAIPGSWLLAGGTWLPVVVSVAVSLVVVGLALRQDRYERRLSIGVGDPPSLRE